MTLAESRMQRRMLIKGTFTGAVDLTEYWFKVCVFRSIKISGTHRHYSVEYSGPYDEGLYVLGITVETIRRAKADCHLEISCVYGNDPRSEDGKEVVLCSQELPLSKP